MYSEDNPNLPTVSEAETAVLEKMEQDDRGELSIAVRASLRDILRAMIEAAKGMWMEKMVESQGMMPARRVYRQRPNLEVAQYLVNQLMGKPRETQVDLQLRQNIIVQNEIKVIRMDQPRDAS